MMVDTYYITLKFYNGSELVHVVTLEAEDFQTVQEYLDISDYTTVEIFGHLESYGSDVPIDDDEEEEEDDDEDMLHIVFES